MKNKSPAFQFYAAEFLADKNVICMTTEEVGAYWLLVSICWRESQLPDDLEELSSLVRMNSEKFQTSWDKRIKRCFQKNEDGFWVHPRLEEERKKQQEFSRLQSKRVSARWSKSNTKEYRGTHPVSDRNNQIDTLQSSVFNLQSSKKEKETEEKEKPGACAPSRVPQEDILKLYHEICPDLPAVRAMTGARSAALKARWRDHPDMKFWDDFFQRVNKSNFLCGRSPPRGSELPFRADFEWITKQGNFVKIVEGRYDNRAEVKKKTWLEKKLEQQNEEDVRNESW